MLRVLPPSFKHVNNLILCQNRFDVGGIKTRNITIQLVLQQCCKTLVARFLLPVYVACVAGVKRGRGRGNLGRSPFLSNACHAGYRICNEYLTQWIWDACDAVLKDESEDNPSSWRRCFFIPNSSFAAGFFRILCIFESINLPVLFNSFGGLPRQNLSLLYFKGIEIWCERGEAAISF